MKGLLLIVSVLLVFPCAASADSAKEWLEVCEGYSRLAETVMRNRHEGVQMQEMLNIVIKGERPSKIAEKIVDEAYGYPRITSFEDLKQRSIGDFKNKWYRECYRAMKAQGKL